MASAWSCNHGRRDPDHTKYKDTVPAATASMTMIFRTTLRYRIAKSPLKPDYAELVAGGGKKVQWKDEKNV